MNSNTGNRRTAMRSILAGTATVLLVAGGASSARAAGTLQPAAVIDGSTRCGAAGTPSQSKGLTVVDGSILEAQAVRAPQPTWSGSGVQLVIGADTNGCPSRRQARLGIGTIVILERGLPLEDSRPVPGTPPEAPPEPAEPSPEGSPEDQP